MFPFPLFTEIGPVFDGIGYKKPCRRIHKDTPNKKGHAAKRKALRKLQRKSRKG